MSLTDLTGGLSLLDGVVQIVAGTNVTISPVGGTGVVTINSSGGGGGGVTSLNGETGVINIVAGANITVTPSGQNITIAGTATGNVVGPSSAADNAITRFDGTTGKLIQNSSVLIDDSANIADSSGLVRIDINNAYLRNSAGNATAKWDDSDNGITFPFGVAMNGSLLNMGTTDEHGIGNVLDMAGGNIWFRPGNDYGQGLFNHDANVLAVDVLNSYLNDNSQVISQDWNQRFLYNFDGIDGIVLIDYSGNGYNPDAGISFLNDQPYFTEGIISAEDDGYSIDTNGRTLNKSGNIAVTDWQNQILNDSSSGLSQNWDTRGLYDQFGNLLISYNGDVTSTAPMYFDQDQFLILQATIKDTSDFGSLNTLGRIMYSTTGAAIWGWGADSGLNAYTHKIANVVDPASAQDAATKNYVDTGLATKAATFIVGNDRKTAQNGAVSLATYTVPASDTTFEISANVLVTTATLHNFAVQVAYTDEGNTARTLTLPFTLLAGTFSTAITNATGAVPHEGVPLHIRCKASTTIIFSTVGSFTTVAYNFEERILKL